MSTTTSSRFPTIVSRKRLLTAQLFHADQLDIQYPQRTHIHEVVYRNATITVFPVTDKNELYLVKQYRYLHEKVSLEAMAGFVEKGEDPLTAAKRELKEETGITAVKWTKLTTFELAASVVKATNHVYLAQYLTLGEANPDEGEDINLVKKPLTTALSDVVNGTIDHAASMIGILMIASKQNKKHL